MTNKPQPDRAFEQALEEYQRAWEVYMQTPGDVDLYTARGQAALDLSRAHTTALSRAREDVQQRGTNAIADMMIRFWTDWAAQNATIGEMIAAQEGR